MDTCPQLEVSLRFAQNGVIVTTCKPESEMEPGKREMFVFKELRDALSFIADYVV